MTAAAASDRRVFISHAYRDAGQADEIIEALRAAGITATSSPDVLEEHLTDAIRASDVIVVLLSEAAARRKWVTWELDLITSGELERRGIDVIAAILDHTDFPDQLERRNAVDLSGDFESGLRSLIRQVKAATRIHYRQLSPDGFEHLVADLLNTLGFRVEAVASPFDAGVDLKATRQVLDPFGSLPEVETWFVQCKLYSSARISVDVIRRMVGLLATAPATTRGLLVSSAQITSVARQYLSELEGTARVRLRVLDGMELTALLRRHPEVVDRNFPAPPVSGPDAVT